MAMRMFPYLEKNTSAMGTQIPSIRRALKCVGQIGQTIIGAVTIVYL